MEQRWGLQLLTQILFCYPLSLRKAWSLWACLGPCSSYKQILWKFRRWASVVGAVRPQGYEVLGVGVMAKKPARVDFGILGLTPFGCLDLVLRGNIGNLEEEAKINEVPVCTGSSRSRQGILGFFCNISTA